MSPFLPNLSVEWLIKYNVVKFDGCDMSYYDELKEQAAASNEDFQEFVKQRPPSSDLFLKFLMVTDWTIAEAAILWDSYLTAYRSTLGTAHQFQITGEDFQRRHPTLNLSIRTIQHCVNTLMDADLLVKVPVPIKEPRKYYMNWPQIKRALLSVPAELPWENIDLRRGDEWKKRFKSSANPATSKT